MPLNHPNQFQILQNQVPQVTFTSWTLFMPTIHHTLAICPKSPMDFSHAFTSPLQYNYHPKLIRTISNSHVITSHNFHMPKASHLCHLLIQNMVTSKYDPYTSHFTVLAFTRQQGSIPNQIKFNAQETTTHTLYIPNQVYPCIKSPQLRSHSQNHLLSSILSKLQLNSQN